MRVLSRLWPRSRWSRRLIVSAVVAGVVVVAASSAWIRLSARGHLYGPDDVPPAPVALVLGAQVDPDGAPSPFLVARLTLAKRLYDDGRVRALLVSGDHGSPDYDEPDAMRAWLIAHGVPERKVVADYAGFDTYDSCSRALRVFGVHQAIVVTQSFHVARAVTLCRRLGIDATGVGDDSVRDRRLSWWRGTLREQGAAVKAVWDVTIRRDPVYLGRHETGVDDALSG